MSKSLLNTHRDLGASMHGSRHPRNSRFTPRTLGQLVVTVGLLAAGYRYLWRQYSHSLDRSFASSDSDVITNENRQEFQQYAIRNLLDTGLPFLENASPITVQDFQERRDRLAEALVAEDTDDFVVEPGYTFKYYGNVSQPEWEAREVSKHAQK
jgi:hypothetical protein